MFNELKAWLCGALLLALVVAGFALYEHGKSVGAAGVQAKWDAENATNTYATLQTDLNQSTEFAGIASEYHEAITNEKPSLPPVTAADVSSGRVSLRDEWTCPGGYVRAGSVVTASGVARADAAAAAAAQQRAEGASDLVQYADAADRRESDLGAQVRGLQATLDAERAKAKGKGK